MRVYWLEAQPWDPVAGAAVTVRATSLPLAGATQMNDVEWLDIIAETPTRQRGVFLGDFKARPAVARGGLTFAAGDGTIDAWSGYNWSNRPVKLWSGEVDTSDPTAPLFPAWDDLTLEWDGQAESYQPGLRRGRLEYTVQLPTGKLAPNSYAGTGGAEGDPEVKGVVKPYAVGRFKNQPAQLVTRSLLLYQLNDGPIEALDEVREAGRLLDQSFVFHTTAVALIAATVPATEIHVCLSAGLFRLGFEPVGEITAYFQGDAAGTEGYVELPGAVIYRLLERAGWNMAQVDTGTLAALNTYVPDAVWVSDTSGTEVTDELDRIMLACGGYWDVTDTGEFYVGLVRRGDPVLVIGSDDEADLEILDIEPLPVRPPFWKNRMGYDFNPRVLTAAELAALEASGTTVMVYRRDFTTPATPTGTTLPPAGWQLDRPAYSQPRVGSGMPADPLRASGPIYSALYQDGVWTVPAIDDPDYLRLNGLKLFPPDDGSGGTPYAGAAKALVDSKSFQRDPALATHTQMISGSGPYLVADTYALSDFDLSEGFYIEFMVTPGTGDDECWFGLAFNTLELPSEDYAPVGWGFYLNTGGSSRFKADSDTEPRVHVVAHDGVLQTTRADGDNTGGLEWPYASLRYAMGYDGHVLTFYLDGAPMCMAKPSGWENFLSDYGLVMAAATQGTKIEVTKFQRTAFATDNPLALVDYIAGPILFAGDKIMMNLPWDDNRAANENEFSEVYWKPMAGALVWDFEIPNSSRVIWAAIDGDSGFGGYGTLGIKTLGDGTYKVDMNGLSTDSFTIDAFPAAVRLADDGATYKLSINNTVVATRAYTNESHENTMRLSLMRGWSWVRHNRFAVSPVVVATAVAPAALPDATSFSGTINDTMGSLGSDGVVRVVVVPDIPVKLGVGTYKITLTLHLAYAYVTGTQWFKPALRISPHSTLGPGTSTAEQFGTTEVSSSGTTSGSFDATFTLTLNSTTAATQLLDIALRNASTGGSGTTWSVNLAGSSYTVEVEKIAASSGVVIAG